MVSVQSVINVIGQLGDGTQSTRDLPVQTALPANFRARSICVGIYHSIAIDESGAVYGWGNNTFYQIGLPNALYLIPTAITTTATVGTFLPNVSVVQVTCGNYHTVALTRYVFSKI
jgi:alpha-tubulin suppressor-like RCC1 family protein